MDNAQPILIRALFDPAGYDHPVDSVRLIETHISWILLTGAYAYKIKKAVNLGFLDFSTLEKRRFYCDEELRLNRRLAPQLYLGVVAIGGSPHVPIINGGGPAIEYAVKMVQFSQEALLDRLLESGALTPLEMDEVAREVARFHQAIASTPTPPGFGTPEAVHRPVLENFAQIAERADRRPEVAVLSALREWSEKEFSRRREDMADRLQNGRIRECHGDLHLGNMALINGRVTLFDCIEFNPNLRWIDVISDAAFAAMDLQDRGHPELAHRFINTYLEQTGDFGGLRVLPYYLVYRAMVRAKVACIRGCQEGLDERQRRAAWEQAAAYLALAERFTRPARTWLLITHGYSGSGKTTWTKSLLEQTGAIRLRSDVERKRLFGLAPQARSQSGLNKGIYTPDAHARTYAHLGERAREILLAGYPVIVDAAFLKRAERDAFQALAKELGIPFLILHLEATPDILRQRIGAREQHGKDASEATLEVLEMQLRGSEALTPEEASGTFVLDTEPPEQARITLQALAGRLMDNPDKICQD